MGDIVMHNVVSVDGFIADANDDIGPLFDWYFNGDTPLTDGSNFQSLGGLGRVRTHHVGKCRVHGDRTPSLRHHERLGRAAPRR